jgi:hypothetical protein
VFVSAWTATTPTPTIPASLAFQGARSVHQRPIVLPVWPCLLLKVTAPAAAPTKPTSLFPQKESGTVLPAGTNAASASMPRPAPPACLPTQRLLTISVSVRPGTLLIPVETACLALTGARTALQLLIFATAALPLCSFRGLSARLSAMMDTPRWVLSAWAVRKVV